MAATMFAAFYLKQPREKDAAHGEADDGDQQQYLFHREAPLAVRHRICNFRTS